TLANWLLEEFSLGRIPGRVVFEPNPGIGCGARHLVDHWPLHAVIRTEGIRLPVPSTGRDFTDGLLGQGQALRVGPATPRDHRQEPRMLPLGTRVVGVTIEAEHP